MVLLFAHTPQEAWPRWAAMILIAVTLYAGFKLWTWWRYSGPAAPLWKHAAYLLAWPGMEPQSFLSPPLAPVPRPSAAEWAMAIVKTSLGVVLLRFAPDLAARQPWYGGWLCMISIGFCLHFGLLHLVSCAYRAIGIPALPLMDRPFYAESLSDLWGRRWNRGFRDLVHRGWFVPLAARYGPDRAMLAVFLISGLIHELAITVPAGGGWGRPTAYFLLQSLGLALERTRRGRWLGLGRGWRGWLWTALFVIGPVNLLFPEAFVSGVMAPFAVWLGELR